MLTLILHCPSDATVVCVIHYNYLQFHTVTGAVYATVQLEIYPSVLLYLTLNVLKLVNVIEHVVILVIIV